MGGGGCDWGKAVSLLFRDMRSQKRVFLPCVIDGLVGRHGGALRYQGCCCWR